MNLDDITRMAREAGYSWSMHISALERFAELVAAAEREACAKVCEDISDAAWEVCESNYTLQDHGQCSGAKKCEQAIRARGEK